MNVLIDEQLSPIRVQKLAEKGIFAQHVAHIGLSGKSDPAIWKRALESGKIVVTANAGESNRLITKSRPVGQIDPTIR